MSINKKIKYKNDLRRIKKQTLKNMIEFIPLHPTAINSNKLKGGSLKDKLKQVITNDPAESEESIEKHLAEGKKSDEGKTIYNRSKGGRLYSFDE